MSVETATIDTGNNVLDYKANEKNEQGVSLGSNGSFPLAGEKVRDLLNGLIKTRPYATIDIKYHWMKVSVKYDSVGTSLLLSRDVSLWRVRQKYRGTLIDEKNIEDLRARGELGVVNENIEAEKGRGRGGSVEALQ